MPYVDDLHLPQVEAPLTRSIAGIGAVEFKNWIVRVPPAILLTDAERAEAAENSRYRFSVNRVTHVTITAELVRVGFAPRAAAMLAGGFTDAGHGISDFGAPIARNRGELFPTGQTLLVAYPGLSIGEVLNATSDTPWHRLLSARGINPAACTVLNLNQIVWRVRAALGLPLNIQPGALG
jgi:hypothetical protein